VHHSAEKVRQPRVTHISEGFDFLGQNVRKYRFGRPNVKLLTKPSKKNVKAFLDKAREIISSHKAVKQEHLIGLLNPMIHGWARYHCHVVASKTFVKVDHTLWHALWKWAVRRHPNKSKKWAHNRYFGRIGNRSHVFQCFVEKNGEIRALCLRNCIDVAIRRHVKVRGEATPYDPRFESYFEARLSLKMENNLAGRRKLLYLWRRQQGLCPVCGEAITRLTRWHVHHLVRRVDGGSDSASNLWMLHPECHRQHHANPKLRWKLPAGLDNPA
jgi:RNA-directed DNA polymerase